MQIDLLLLNANIWTGNPGQPRAQALAAAGGQIVAIGSTAELKSLSGRGTVVIDAGGNLVLPGFIDNHTHFLTGGFHLLSANLRDVSGPSDLARRLAEKAKELPEGRWITGGGWNHENWSPGGLPSRQTIDAATSRHPVFVTRQDLHMGLANSLALSLAGIGRDTPNPPGGWIERDARTGEPTGIVKDAAMDLVLDIIPAPSGDEYAQALAAALKHAAALGITSIQDITAWEDWAVFRRFWENGWLTLRVFARTPIPEWERQLETLIETGRGDDWLRLGGVKGFVDGALGSGTALMCEPYSDEPANSGLLFGQMYPEGIMKRRIEQAHQAGLPVSLHAIGDKANQLLLDMYEDVLRTCKTTSRGLRIEHAQHLRPEDIERMGRLKLTVAMQPVHLLDDGGWAGRRLGEKRSLTTFACRSVLDSGANLTFGTDWPVAPLNPLLGIYAATARIPSGSRTSWVPGQSVSVEEAVQAYTAAGAYAEFAEHSKGSLAPGKLADLVVLSRDIFRDDPAAILETEVLYTVLNGKILYQKTP